MQLPAQFFKFCFMVGIGREECSHYLKNYYIFRTFIRFVFFPQVLGQVNEWPILKWHEMIRMLHIVACPIVFILFFVRAWQGGVLKMRSLFSAFSRNGQTK